MRFLPQKNQLYILGLKAVCLLLLFIVPVYSSAQTEPELANQGKAEKILLTKEQGEALLEQGKKIREEAETAHEEKKTLCWQKFFVNDCLSAAKKEYVKQIQQARVLEQQGREAVRAANLQVLDAKEKQRDADLIENEYKKQQQAEQQKIKLEEELAEAERRQAEKNQQIADKKIQASSEKEADRKMQQEKAEKRLRSEQKARERAEAAAKNKAENEAKLAERAKKIAEKEAAANQQQAGSP